MKIIKLLTGAIFTSIISFHSAFASDWLAAFPETQECIPLSTLFSNKKLSTPDDVAIFLNTNGASASIQYLSRTQGILKIIDNNEVINRPVFKDIPECKNCSQYNKGCAPNYQIQYLAFTKVIVTGWKLALRIMQKELHW